MNDKITTDRFKNILSSQSGTTYTHNCIFSSNIYNYDILFIYTPKGIIPVYNFDGTLAPCPQYAMEGSSWRYITCIISNIGSDGLSAKIETAIWTNSSSNAGISITSIYGAKFNI